MKEKNQDVLDYAVTEKEVSDKGNMLKPVEKIAESVLDSLTRPIGTSFVDTIIKGV